jgi:hypothetical protein
MCEGGRRDVGGRSDEARGDEVVWVVGKDRVEAALTLAACANLIWRFVFVVSL